MIHILLQPDYEDSHFLEIYEGPPGDGQKIYNDFILKLSDATYEPEVLGGVSRRVMTPERIERQQKYLKEVYEQCTGIEAALPLKIIIVFQAYVEKKLGWKPVSYSTVIL